MASLVQQDSSQRAIPRLLGRSPSTVCHELARNAAGCQGYVSTTAQARCETRRKLARPLPKLHSDDALWRIVGDLLLWRWSPQQIESPRVWGGSTL
ncbi:helix-turn-helix domain-containing protein [Acidovorax sp. Root217]|uniref:helix-turn-helix domain-containing protein n=1 Tax=Acidovorax sp. Root217 TaxID=1736492 RepID=UPI0012F8C49E